MQTRSTEQKGAQTLLRPIVRKLHAYVPGEQPKIKDLIKLNTNENPYGPSPQVLEALKGAIDGRLRLYPNSGADGLREKLARLHGCQPDNIIVGNGSDELLALATRAFVEPLTGLTQYALHAATTQASHASSEHKRPPLPPEAKNALIPSRYAVQFLTPSYSLYPVLAAIHGAWPKAVRLNEDFTLPSLAELMKAGWNCRAALTFVTTPNAPSGRGMTLAELDQLCQVHRGVIILDEAYVDFADHHAMSLALKYPQVIVSRTFSKAYSLCALRVGYFVGHPDVVAGLHKVRDSYNVNALGQVAAEATLDSLDYYRQNFARVIRSRQQLTAQLTALGFKVLPSQTNFILTEPPRFSAETWLEKLRAERILVRWFDLPEVRAYLRITIGSEPEIEALLSAAKTILSRN